MKYENPYSRKIRNSYLMGVSCGYCKEPIAIYQKVGVGQLRRMKIDRIIESEFDLTKHEGRLNCPFCGEHIGSKVELDDSSAYRMIKGAHNTIRIDR